MARRREKKAGFSSFLCFSWLPGLRGAAAFRDSMEVVEERTQKITGPALCLIQPLERVPGHHLQTAKQSKSRL